MTIAHDAQTRFPATDGTSGTNSVSTAAGNVTFDHNPVGTPKGVVVLAYYPANGGAATTPQWDSIQYAGTTMTELGHAYDDSEHCNIWIYTLTDTDIPTNDPATVTIVNKNGSGTWFTCQTVTAGTSQTKVEDTTFTNITISADPSVTMTTSVATISYGGVGSGAAAPPTSVTTGCTLQFQNDTGTRAQSTLRRTSEDAAGSPVLGYTLASDDWCMCGVSLAEKSTAATPSLTPVKQQMPSYISSR